MRRRFYARLECERYLRRLAVVGVILLGAVATVLTMTALAG